MEIESVVKAIEEDKKIREGMREGKCFFCERTGLMLVVGAKPKELYFCDIFCQNEYFRAKIHGLFDRI